MAIVDNFWLKGQRKKLGGSVIYQAMGQTRQRALASEVSNPRTQAQMAQRVRWSNLVNLYRVNANWMKFAFETKKQSQSDYNKFMSLNVANSPIFLPKQVAAAGGCIVAPYIITQGSLPSIESVEVSENWYTNLYLDGTSSIGSLTTIAAISAELLEYNPALHEGDQLSFIRMTQQTNSSTGIPYVIVRKYEFILSTTDTRLLGEFWPLDIIMSEAYGESAAIMVNNTGNAGGWAMILSRTIGGKTFVSSQSIIVANNTALIDYYSGAAALQRAIDSYGVSDEPFLTTVTAKVSPGVSTPLSILDVVVDNVHYVPGTVARDLPNWASKQIEIYFSGDVTGDMFDASIEFISSSGDWTGTIDDLTSSGNKLVANLPPSFSNTRGHAIYKVKVQIGDYYYEATYAVDNQDTIHGLE